MRIIVVIENQGGERLRGEKGLSFFLESKESNYLIDTGLGELILENLDKLGIRPNELNNIIISHNHIDHIGGLQYLIKKADKAKIYISQNALGEFVKFTFGEIDVLSDTGMLYGNLDRVMFIDGDVEVISRNVVLCHVANPAAEFRAKDDKLFEMVDGEMQPDNFGHEMYVAVVEDGALNIISPCSHNGIVNIINDAKKRFPNKALGSYVGGLHLQGSADKLESYSADEIASLAAALNETGLKALYTCHCTGKEAYAILKKNCTFPVKYLKTGQEINI